MKILAFVLFVLLMSSCGSNKTKHPLAASVQDTAKFYPLRTFFKEQLEYVDLRDFPLYRITVKDGKKDSVTISKDEFAAYAAVFLQRDISAPQTKMLYKESVFQDLSTGSVTINYTPMDNGATVQNIDILLDEATSIVKRVFIRSQYIKGDTTVTEQCNWKANKSFQVNKTFATKNGYTSTEFNYINWNDKP